jgi:hypothetical protein
MVANSLRSPAHDPRDPVIYDLPPLRFEGKLVTLRLSLRQSEDGFWRGRLGFVESGDARETAEIFCAQSERELWDSVRALGEHHLRDLYRSVG